MKILLGCAKYPNIVFHVKLTSRKEGTKGFQTTEEEFGKVYVHTLSRRGFTLFLYNKRSRSRDPPLERVPHGAKPRIPDINVKFAFRLSTPCLLFPRSSPFSPFVTEGETVSFPIPPRDCISPFLCLSTLPPSFSRIFRSPLVSQSPLLVFLRRAAATKFQLLSVSFENTYIHFHVLKLPAFSPSYYCPSPLSSFLRVLPISRQGETTNEVQEE